MIIPRTFNNGRVGIVSRIPEWAMTPLRVAARPFRLGTPENRMPSIQSVDDPRVMNTSPPMIEFLSYSPTLTPPVGAVNGRAPPCVPFEEQMMAGVDQCGQVTFMPIQMSGFAAVTAIVAKAETQLNSVVADIKASVAARAALPCFGNS